MRILKIFGIVVGALVLLLAVVLVAVYFLFDPNDYKDRIAAAVKQSTGRELSLPGRLSLSIFPWIAIETGEASLGNPPGFGNEKFLTLKRAKLSVMLMPLLHKQLQIGRIEIDGLDLRLKQDATGKGNWVDWGSKAGTPAQPASGPTPEFDLAGVVITNSRIAFEAMVARSREDRDRPHGQRRGVSAVAEHRSHHRPWREAAAAVAGRQAVARPRPAALCLP